MRIRIQKHTDGIKFDLLNAKGEVSDKTMGPATKAAMSRVAEWYRARVNMAFDATRLHDSGYRHDFNHKAYPITETERRKGKSGKTKEVELAQRFMKLEPVGFALVGDDGEPVMNDCGSTPTEARAIALACYQAPLVKVDAGEGRVCFERIVTVVDGKVVL